LRIGVGRMIACSAGVRYLSYCVMNRPATWFCAVMTSVHPRGDLREGADRLVQILVGELLVDREPDDAGVQMCSEAGHQKRPAAVAQSASAASATTAPPDELAWVNFLTHTGAPFAGVERPVD
jgi:hypothetical protein